PKRHADRISLQLHIGAWRMRRIFLPSSWIAVLVSVLFSQILFASPFQSQHRRISGVIVTSKDEAVKGVTVIARSAGSAQSAVTDDDGEFSLDAPNEEITLQVRGPYIKPEEQTIRMDDSSESLRIAIEFLIPPIDQSIVVTATALEPQIETRSD